MSKNVSPFTLVGAGALLGLAAGYAFSLFREPPPIADEQEVGESVAIAKSMAAESVLQKQVERLEKENAELRAQVAAHSAAEAGLAAKPVSGSTLAAAPGEGTSHGPDMERMRPHMRRFAEMRLAKYQARLNLTEAQRQSLIDIMVLREEQLHRSRIAQATEGEGTNEVAANPAPEVGRVTNQDILDLAREILSPEQFAEYQAVQQEERQSRNEMIATARLGELAPALGLTSQQKDAAYSIFYAEADTMDFDAGPESAQAARARSETALERILDAEQLAAYQAYRAQQERAGAAGNFFIVAP